MRLPEVVAAADWSFDNARRRLVVAKLRSNRYAVDDPPQPIAEPGRLLGYLRHLAGDGTALVGFDFPIGLPAAYAARAGLAAFRGTLGEFGKQGLWRDFFEVTDDPSLYQPFGPRSNLKGGLTRPELAERLGLSEAQLFRRCDAKTPARNRAEIIFYTRFAKQVGRSALHGWQTVLQPALDDFRLWPFDGDLERLLAEPGLVVAEIYPAEAVAQLRLPLGPGTPYSKGRRQDRESASGALAQAATLAGIDLSPSTRLALDSGFETDDDFDAFTALVSMLNVVRGLRPAGAPAEERVTRYEGWILGQADIPFRAVARPRPNRIGVAGSANGRPSRRRRAGRRSNSLARTRCARPDRGPLSP